MLIFFHVVLCVALGPFWVHADEVLPHVGLHRKLPLINVIGGTKALNFSIAIVHALFVFANVASVAA